MGTRPSRRPDPRHWPGRHAVTPFFVAWVSEWRGFVRNKANPQRSVEFEVGGFKSGTGRQSCETNPIAWRRRRGRTCGGMPALPLATSALRRPIVQSEPNSPAMPGGPGYRSVARGANAQNEPNSRRRRLGRGHRVPPSPLALRASGLPGRIVQNKANLPDGPNGDKGLREREL